MTKKYQQIQPEIRLDFFDITNLSVYYLKINRDFGTKCQKRLAICAKWIYNHSAICEIRICAIF